MDWQEIAAFVAANLAVFGIIGKMVSGKVNKSECELKHDYLKKSMENIEKNSTKANENILKIMVTLAKTNGEDRS